MGYLRQVHSAPRTLPPDPELETTWMRYPFLLAEGIDRTAVQEFLLERDVPTRMVWTGNVLRQPAFAKIPHRAAPGGYPNADRVMEQGLVLPSNHGLDDDDIDYICATVDSFF